MRDPSEKLKDILEAIDHIERYSTQGQKAFEENELIQNWFIRHLLIIGEAVRALPQEIRDSVPDVPWSKIIGMRNILVHDYFEIDKKLVWDVVANDLPYLKRQIKKALDML